MTIAFVLTGGGSLGAVQVGMLNALHEQGIHADLLVGTSVGAVNAAYLGGPGRRADRLRTLAMLWRGMRRHDIFAVDLRRWFGAAVGTRSSLFDGQGLDGLLRRNLGYEDLEQARIPVEVTATDLVTGHGLVLATGPAVSAVRASAAVPGVLPPVTRDGRTLVDGAIGELDVLAHTAAHGVSDIYLLPAGYPCAGAPPTSALGGALTALSLLLHRQLMAQVNGYRGDARLHVVPPLCPLSVSPADFTQTPTLLARAHESTSTWLAAGRRIDDASVLSLHVHHRPPGTVGEQATHPERGLIT
ncbi:patatin-like phospholipase family protein [Terrabacter sp. 2RAF25]|uniref:patatin-like phospholipase family protein n=1 Tax=Terrabacter sp. 2RAF25 TaxID=3232998 RepID=UPI003F9863AE